MCQLAVFEFNLCSGICKERLRKGTKLWHDSHTLRQTSSFCILNSWRRNTWKTYVEGFLFRPHPLHPAKAAGCLYRRCVWFMSVGTVLLGAAFTDFLSSVNFSNTAALRRHSDRSAGYSPNSHSRYLGSIPVCLYGICGEQSGTESVCCENFCFPVQYHSTSTP